MPRLSAISFFFLEYLFLSRGFGSVLDKSKGDVFLRVLVACEESQVVCSAFRALGHEAYSCDIQDCSGGHPEWHIKGDCLTVLYDNWDLIIAHPPCTYLSVAGNSWFNVSRYGSKALERLRLRDDALRFFEVFLSLSCPKICIENPIGTVNSLHPCTQVIQPFWFGDPERKSTCLWLKGLPKLRPTQVVKPNLIYYKNGRGSDSPWHMNSISLPTEERRKLRSKTFPGIAAAMASQWGSLEV